MNKFLIRFSDLFASLLGLILLSPILICIAIWIKSDTPGPVIFRQKRVGFRGKDFELFKFRTMVMDADRKGLITVGSRDPRITKAGFLLRKYKLDEFPQLWNVLKGEMSLVGPRPEVRKYVDLYTEEQKQVLMVKPGITDLASVAFSHENELLSKQANPDEYYIKVLVPEKIRLNRHFIEHPTWLNYIRIILKTLGGIFGSSDNRTN